MRLTPPRKITFLIAIILGLLGIFGNLTPIPVVSSYAFWLLAFGFVLLALGCMLKGL
jgi:hypothetical protein